MKIGEFSQHFNLSSETVRYYINKGLLVPVTKNDRYDFCDRDIEDMKLLQKLKSFRFSITDIHKILSLKRLSNLDSPEELNDYINILKAQKKVMLNERARLNKVIDGLQQEISTASGKHTGAIQRKSGVPLAFLPYLACPYCQGNLSINNCNIERDQIISGGLSCACGFNATIQNGILIGQPGKISIYDSPDVERNCYRMMSPSLITLVQKAYNWMLECLNRCDTKGKLILEDFVNNYCFCHSNFEAMDKDAYYIITDKYPEIVAVYKNLIDKLNLDLQVLYIAAGSHLLPLKNKCVDIYIDFDASNEYAIFHNGYAADALTRYFHQDTYALGAFFSLKPGGPSVQELHRQYPETWEKCFDIAYFRKYMQEMWQSTLDYDNIGYVTDSGGDLSFSYHIPGEKLGLNTYFMHGFKGPVKKMI
ncbi:MAG: MerR family transcriptional regulator [Caulobacteraceae bacterium]